jgi:hypothetical protein
VLEVLEKIWTALDLQLPLIIEDFTYYLLKERIFNEDDLNKLLEIKKLLKMNYEIIVRNKKIVKNEILRNMEEIQAKLNSLQPKKPMPAEMKRRLEDFKNNINSIIDFINKIS